MLQSLCCCVAVSMLQCVAESVADMKVHRKIDDMQIAKTSSTTYLAVCYNVLQCVEVFRSVSQCVAMFCSMLQCL